MIIKSLESDVTAGGGTASLCLNQWKVNMLSNVGLGRSREMIKFKPDWICNLSYFRLLLYERKKSSRQFVLASTDVLKMPMDFNASLLLSGSSKFLSQILFCFQHYFSSVHHNRWHDYFMPTAFLPPAVWEFGILSSQIPFWELSLYKSSMLHYLLEKRKEKKSLKII